MLARYRRLGADLPFGDPARRHGTAFEGFFHRLTLNATGEVLIVVRGVSRDAAGELWGTHAMAFGDTVVEAPPSPTHVPLDPTRISLRVDERTWVDASVHAPARYPRGLFGGLGAGQVVPGLSQYWHPSLLGGRVTGRAQIGGREVDLDGATAYAEGNWGRGGFAERWWWGSAQGFPGAEEDVCVCFAGGRAGIGPLQMPATAIVARVGDRVIRASTPLRRVNADVDESGWRVRGGGIELEGDANGTRPALLPIPLPKEHRNLSGAAAQHLRGHVRLKVRHKGALLFEGESTLAGLERGDAPAAHARAAARATL